MNKKIQTIYEGFNVFGFQIKRPIKTIVIAERFLIKFKRANGFINVVEQGALK